MRADQSPQWAHFSLFPLSELAISSFPAIGARLIFLSLRPRDICERAEMDGGNGSGRERERRLIIIYGDFLKGCAQDIFLFGGTRSYIFGVSCGKYIGLSGD